MAPAETKKKTPTIIVTEMTIGVGADGSYYPLTPEEVVEEIEIDSLPIIGEEDEERIDEDES